ncbi:3-oxoacyl-ACP reductase [Sphingomonas sp. Root710]|uniref:SDR family oxidoreductase n=1 Tax=Sphingomonas sp. Root710 TaxID=1736594 RepID=UPI0006FDAAED|nr:SDR family oxidoreductase [Sphingomonas sp. Root710]KRB86395.1 3-oxoacyl-ACP reductase [Sphingomonas sp. Root710]
MTVNAASGLNIGTLFGVAGKTVIVTGGGRGIGKMIAEGFVRNGARVYISSRSASDCETTAQELGAFGTCIALPCDLSTLAGTQQLADHYGAHETALDILINNAGATWGSPLDDFPESGWDKTMNLNLKGVFFLTQHLLGPLRAAAAASGDARIINIASVDALRPSPMDNFAYGASKAGCLMLTRQLAKRLAAENILVNAIAPGPFKTKMMAAFLADEDAELIRANPLRRSGSPGDIAGTAIFLGSAASAYMTGAVLPCDGGMAEIA